MKCLVCDGESTTEFTTEIMHKYTVQYYRCHICGFVQTEPPYWLSEAYKEPIQVADTGLLARNIHFSKLTAAIILAFFDPKSLYLDYAGGFGVMTRLMRDMGFDFYWHDEFAPNILARGFEYDFKKGNVEMATAFEVFEHFAKPVEEFTKIIGVTRNILFSTILVSTPPPKAGDWWYYSPHHGQHISFYTLKSLQILASSKQLKLFSNGRDFHMMTDKNIPPIAFAAVMKLRRLGLSYIARRIVESKTEADMNFLVGRDA